MMKDNVPHYSLQIDWNEAVEIHQTICRRIDELELGMTTCESYYGRMELDNARRHLASAADKIFALVGDPEHPIRMSRP
jgi:hypothetical protein